MKNRFLHKFQRNNETFWVEDLEQEILNIYSDTGVKSINIGKDKFASVSKRDFNEFMKWELDGFTETME